MLPDQKFAHGSWLGLTGPDPSGPHTGDTNVLVTELDKKRIIGEVLQVGVETLFCTHVYSFKGSLYCKADGGLPTTLTGSWMHCTWMMVGLPCMAS